MTDEMLAWQTERFNELAVAPATVHDHYVVEVRPEQVVEIAFDGLQLSTRYPGGVALRFARVVRYRDDKSAEEPTRLSQSARPCPDRQGRCLQATLLAPNPRQGPACKQRCLHRISRAALPACSRELRGRTGGPRRCRW